MVTRKIKIQNLAGLHPKLAGKLCQEAVQYQCSVTFQYGRGTANAKSVLGVLAAKVKCGDEILLQCDGEDEEEALRELGDFIESGLGE